MKKDKYTFISYVKEELGLIDWVFALESIVEALPVLLVIPIDGLILCYCAENMSVNTPIFLRILGTLAPMAIVLFVGAYISFMIEDYHDHKRRYKKELKKNEPRSIDE